MASLSKSMNSFEVYGVVSSNERNTVKEASDRPEPGISRWILGVGTFYSSFLAASWDI